MPSVRKLEFTAGYEVVTYVARNLEPYRAFDGFCAACLPFLSSDSMIVGGDKPATGTAYSMDRHTGSACWRNLANVFANIRQNAAPHHR